MRRRWSPGGFDASRAPPAREEPTSDRGRLEAEADDLALRVALRPGTGDVRRDAGAALGRDLSRVRLHHDRAAGRRATAAGAEALAEGEDVYFAPGRYRPDHPLGRALIAHELAHVAQQAEGRAPPHAGARMQLFECAEVPSRSPERTPEESAEEEAPAREPPTVPGPTPERLAELAEAAEVEGEIPDPAEHDTFEGWLAAFPAYPPGAEEDVDVTWLAPADLAAEVEDRQLDCADVATMLRHTWLEAHGRTLTFEAGDRTHTIGADRSAAEAAGVCTGSVSARHFRGRVVDLYGGARSPEQNLKALLDAGLKPGDVLVWRKPDDKDGRYTGHVQTITAIHPPRADGGGEPAEGTIEVIQGTMGSEGGAGTMKLRRMSFWQLTGDDGGDAEIRSLPVPAGRGDELPAPAVVFHGAGRWKE